MKKKLLPYFLIIALSTSCISTRLTIKNIDDFALVPPLSKEKTFILTEISSDDKYGYDPDYPVNLGYLPIRNAVINVKRYFGALSGPEGQAITYKLVDSCCPFPSSKNNMGAGILDIYEINWEGLTEPKRIHINLYERGKVIAPLGLGIKKIL
ncbi:MAG: 2-dehydro-3-deoxyphosphooctonate aldolase [Flavobacterium sp. MedPE-SWcel]|uniref:2-dehydro-3-deoxyphosphooctonate aldolase n=1 Tax=uncultured Flavobacterium sp. TaxID=165435 RepID=UPI00091C6D3F|nr:2-dehydro-3-deoxyphosphooctonate aldolase [uncultured Flavobacterium sp.]OIQ20148.1 MAG: 2-dehydro-3-deoxyphosphooctonate aldolase [Flavobacterium sp. MedPE-SWcel]